MVKVGRAQALELDDLPDLRHRCTMEQAAAVIQPIWDEEQLRERPVTQRAFTRAFARPTLPAVLYAFVWGLFNVLSAGVFLPALLRFVSDPTQTSSAGWAFAVALLVSNALVNAGYTHSFLSQMYVGVQCRQAFQYLCFSHLMKVKSTGGSLGATVNMIVSDSQTIFNSVHFMGMVSAQPLVFVAIVVLLFVNLGVSALPGILFLLSGIPMTLVASKAMSAIRARLNPLTDQRLQTMGEIIREIQLVKLMTWESLFHSRISSMRAAEIKLLKKNQMIATVLQNWGQVSVILGVGVSVITYTALDNVLTPPFFASVVLFHQLVMPLTFALFFIKNYMMAKPSFPRLNTFLSTDVWQEPVRMEVTEEPAVDVQVESFRYPEGSGDALSDVSFKLGGRGLVVSIVGSVGASKTTLLKLMIGAFGGDEAATITGRRIAYVPQQPWIINDTFRNNILLGRTYDEAKYAACVSRAALKRDLDQLGPMRDNALVGERGVQLSGGQRARICLARALYDDAVDVLFMDDVLSAVDSHVGRYLWDNAIRANKNSLTVIVNNQLQFAPDSDLIILVEDGRVPHKALSYQDLLERSETFRQMMEQYTMEDEEDRQAARKGQDADMLIASDDIDAEKIQAETMNKGGVSFKVWLSYARAMTGGVPAFLCTAFILVIAAALSIGLEIFVALWINGQLEGIQLSPIIGYTLLLVFFFLTISVFFLLMASLESSAGQKLHDALFSTIMKLPMSFFDSTPTGRVLNSFSGDLYVVDMMLPFPFTYTQFGLVNLVGFLAVIGASFPWFFIAVVPLGVSFYYLVGVLRKVLQQIVRLEGVARGPVVSSVTETATGLDIMRVFQRTAQVQRRFERVSDDWARITCAFWGLQRWFTLRLDFLSTLIIFLTSALGVALKGGVAAAYTGIALTYAIRSLGITNWTLRSFSEAEAYLVSVERLLAYTKLDTESRLQREKPEQWPSKGALQFRNASMSYGGRDSPEVLKDISVNIPGGAKVGVVGRTGAGKSSLIAALFRLRELSSGSIWIDGIEIGSLPLETLRSSISIIPQQPAIFSGDLRRNLDPFHQYSTVELIDVMNRCQLQLEGGLAAPIEARGTNLSAGECQLICLARAMLKRPRILVLDEASASIDTQTDAILQKAIRTVFKNSTLINIAHRLNTVVDSDYVAVLDKGMLVEFGAPAELLRNTEGAFSALVAETGKNTSSHLSRVADKNLSLSRFHLVSQEAGALSPMGEDEEEDSHQSFEAQFQYSLAQL